MCSVAPSWLSAGGYRAARCWSSPRRRCSWSSSRSPAQDSKKIRRTQDRFGREHHDFMINIVAEPAPPHNVGSITEFESKFVYLVSKYFYKFLWPKNVSCRLPCYRTITIVYYYQFMPIALQSGLWICFHFLRIWIQPFSKNYLTFWSCKIQKMIAQTKDPIKLVRIYFAYPDHRGKMNADPSG